MLKCLNNKGFTLIEVIVVVFIITVGLLVVFNAVQSITVYSRLAASRLTATYLAQEGIEMVRNQRDTNWIKKINGLSVSWNDNIPPTAWPLECGQLDILGKFDRVCITTYDGGPPEKMIISVGVSWEERGTSHSVTSTTELYNWLP